MNMHRPNDGLNTQEVISSRQAHGTNSLELKEERVFMHVVKEVVLEPMFILLLAACVVYFVAGQLQEGFIMLVSIFIVAGISFFQEYRSRNAIQVLKKMSANMVTVRRQGVLEKIASDDVVVGDILLLEEGELVAADGLIISANDFSLNESILTGESFAVFKGSDNQSVVYRGTLVVSGSAEVKVTDVGIKTMFGKIGLSIQDIVTTKTPLQQQVRSFVRYMVWIGSVAFVLVIGFNYYQSCNLMESFLQGLTLAMSILPEEIPVAFSTFQALGAFRLLRQQIIVKQPQYVEALGSATVICADKTGTLTENKMSIEYIYDYSSGTSIHVPAMGKRFLPIIEYAMWSSETTAFDPMEKAIHALYGQHCINDLRTSYKQVHEYPIGGQPPFMTHIFQNESGETIIAAKGAPEAIWNQSGLPDAERRKIEEQSKLYAQQGFRVLGVGKGLWKESRWPVSQQEFVFEFLGLIAFHDPPKAHIRETIKAFHDAGISVKMITGDFPETARAIAREIGLGEQEAMTGKEVLHLSKSQLQQKVEHVSIYARMFPEAKLKVIDALKDNGAVVAMTGDGVNDGPALKAAHIGIAMGKRGSEVAKGAASLILMDDDLSHMVDAVALGRRIYDNLKKAIQYIVSIHIPIILVVTLPLLFGWAFTDIFSPVHVIFLELIMGPTCSIIYENEPMEKGTMLRPPRKMGNTFLSWKQLSLSVIQGLAITAGCLGIGYYFNRSGSGNDEVRTVIFITILFSNIFLTMVNRSFHESIVKTILYHNRLVPLIIFITLVFIFAIIFFPFLRDLFRLVALGADHLLLCMAVAFVSTCWIELWKFFNRKRARVH